MNTKLSTTAESDLCNLLKSQIRDVWFAVNDQGSELLAAHAHAEMGEYADCAECLARIDGIPTELADRIETTLTGLGVDLG